MTDDTSWLPLLPRDIISSEQKCFPISYAIYILHVVV